MATEAPSALDITDLQFRLHNTSQLFLGDSQLFDKCNLLATASLYGLVIAGTSKPELKVTQLSSIVANKADAIPSRTIHLAQVPRTLALSCDHSMLAVNYDQNGSTFISVFSVPTFLSNNVSLLYQNIVLSPELNVQVVELLWNPVIPNTLAVTLNNGSLSVLNFNGPGYELHVIDKGEEVRCASWSPKGKQIVVGFPAGKLAQYKPDLKLARTIPCPEGVFDAPFDVITVQWLSTYQFAAVFLKRGQGECPAVFIVNAPKNIAPTYVNYDDICYSQSGPRSSQMFLQHILPWNIILVASANSMEIGILGTREAGETPVWSQYTLDEMRPELPLTADKQESYPIGMVVDTGCSHRCTIDEIQLDPMPMLHLLTTYGQIVSFDVVNQLAGMPTLCQAPKQVADVSGLAQFTANGNAVTAPLPPVKTTSDSFSLPANVVTSTPAAQKSKPPIFNSDAKPSSTNLFGGGAEPPKSVPFAGGTSLFGGQSNQPAVPPGTKNSFGGFGSDQPGAAPPSFASATASSFGAPVNPSTAFGGSSMFGGSNIAKPAFGAASSVAPFIGQSQSISTSKPPNFGGQPAAPVKPIGSAAPNAALDAKQPFVTVPSNYSAQSTEKNNHHAHAAPNSNASFGSDDNRVIRQMITEEIDAFEQDWSAVLQRGRQLKINIGTKDEMSVSGKQLAELQDITNQATESTDALTMEIQTLRMSLNETFSMVTEAKAKRAMFENLDVNTLRDTSTMSQTSRRTLEKLQRLLATNEAQYHIVNKQIDAFWSSHQQNVKQNQKAMMHIPQMENVYMTLTKQRQILKRNAQELGYIKSKLGYRDMGAVLKGSKTTHDLTVNSITDSIFSLSLCEQVKRDTERISDVKMGALRDLLRSRQTISVITPKRPDRKGISSEVVMGRKLAQERKKVVPVVTTPTIAKRAEPVRALPTRAQVPASQPAPNPVPQTKPSTGFGSQIADNKPFGFSTSAAPISFGSASKEPTTAAAPSFGQSKPSTFTLPAPKPQSTAGFGFKTPDATVSASSPFSISGTSMFGGAPNKTFSTPEPSPFSNAAAIVSPTNPVTSGLPFGTSAPSAKTTFGTSSVASSTPKPSIPFAPSSAAASKPSAFTFNTGMGNPSFGSPNAKPLTPTLNALLPKGIAAAAAAEAKPPTPVNTFTSNSPFNTKPTAVEDKENQAKPLVAPTIGSISNPATTSNIFSGSSSANVFGATGNSSFGGALGSAFGSIQTKSTSAAANTTSVFANTLNLAKSTSPPTPSSGTPSPKTVTSASVSPASSSSTSSNNAPGQGFTFSLQEGGSTTVTSVPISKPTATLATVPTPTAATNATDDPHSSTTADATDTLFQGLNVCKPVATAVTSTFAANPPASAGSNIFAAFGASTTTTAAPSTTSIFGGSPAVTTAAFAPSANVFGQATKPEPTTAATSGTSATQSTSGGSSPFAAFAAQNPGPPSAGTSIFGGAAAGADLVKPDQSVFGGSSSSTNVFGSSPAATPTTNVFGGGSGSVFGGGSTAAAPTAGSPFGASASGSLFGQSSFGQPATTTNVFGQSAASPAAGGSLFGSSSVFGGASPAAPTTAVTTTSIFGGGSALAPSAFGSSSFGSPAASSAFGQSSSVFGGGNAAAAQPVAAGGSMFSGGFGSPSAAPSAFGGPPAFGAPSFGGAATFGSPKAAGFGSFGQTAASPPAFAAQVTQKNSLFESLGSSESGMTFGNIAQNTNQAAPSAFGGANLAPNSNQAAPSAFGGGSSFSSWR